MVGLVKQDTRTETVARAILGQLGVEHEVTGTSKTSCVVDTRERERRDGPSPNQDGVVYLDDFLSMEQVELAMKGHPLGTQDFYSEPLLSAQAHRFFDALKASYAAKGLPLVTKCYWPHNAPGCLVLTHDVDWMTYSPLHKAVMAGKSPGRYLGLASRYVLGRKKSYSIGSLLRLEREYGVKSTFLFRTKYASDFRLLEGAMNECREAGCELALHAAGRSHREPEEMVQERKAMEALTGTRVAGTRQHGLKFVPDLTWTCVEAAGLAYDLTFGENERTGFIAGLCHPYHPLSPSGVPYALLEIPTSFMDWTAVHARLEYSAVVAILKRLTESVVALNGCLCVNFHNTYVDAGLFPAVERAYRFLLDKCVQAGFWTATAEECSSWWKRRERAVLSASWFSGALKAKSSDPLVGIKVHWPDGRTEFLDGEGKAGPR